MSDPKHPKYDTGRTCGGWERVLLVTLKSLPPNGHELVRVLIGCLPSALALPQDVSLQLALADLMSVKQHREVSLVARSHCTNLPGDELIRVGKVE